MIRELLNREYGFPEGVTYTDMDGLQADSLSRNPRFGKQNLEAVLLLRPEL